MKVTNIVHAKNTGLEKRTKELVQQAIAQGKRVGEIDVKIQFHSPVHNVPTSIWDNLEYIKHFRT